MKAPTLGLKGRALISVIDHDGNTVYAHPWEGNLLLDKGLDAIAEMPIADIFLYATKGTESAPPKRAGAGTISQALNSVTATSANFTSDDVGRIIRWTSGTGSGTERRIMSVTSSTVVEVDGVPATVAAGSFNVYAVNKTAMTTEVGPRTDNYSDAANENSTVTVGSKRTLKRTFLFPSETASASYDGIAFSHLPNVGSQINILIRLSSPVAVSGPSGATPGQRLKVTYELDITVTPNTATAVNLGTLITDAGSDMSSNKNATYVVETFATSRISIGGDTDPVLSDLEPSVEGFMGISSDTTALVFNGGTQRTANVDYVPLEFEEDYVPGTYERSFRGTFDLEDANRNDLRSLMLFNPDTNNAIVTYLFNSNQKKDTNHALTIIWSKKWGRDLS